MYNFLGSEIFETKTQKNSQNYFCSQITTDPLAYTKFLKNIFRFNGAK